MDRRSRVEPSRCSTWHSACTNQDPVEVSEVSKGDMVDRPTIVYSPALVFLQE
jgi:hypothetical protein